MYRKFFSNWSPSRKLICKTNKAVYRKRFLFCCVTSAYLWYGFPFWEPNLKWRGLYQLVRMSDFTLSFCSLLIGICLASRGISSLVVRESIHHITDQNLFSLCFGIHGICCLIYHICPYVLYIWTSVNKTRSEIRNNSQNHINLWRKSSVLLVINLDSVPDLRRMAVLSQGVGYGVVIGLGALFAGVYRWPIWNGRFVINN
jgi:hypothetical protein